MRQVLVGVFWSRLLCLLLLLGAGVVQASSEKARGTARILHEAQSLGQPAVETPGQPAVETSGSRYGLRQRQPRSHVHTLRKSRNTVEKKNPRGGKIAQKDSVLALAGAVNAVDAHSADGVSTRQGRQSVNGEAEQPPIVSSTPSIATPSSELSDQNIPSGKDTEPTQGASVESNATADGANTGDQHHPPAASNDRNIPSDEDTEPAKDASVESNATADGTNTGDQHHPPAASNDQNIPSVELTTDASAEGATADGTNTGDQLHSPAASNDQNISSVEPTTDASAAGVIADGTNTGDQHHPPCRFE